MSIPARSAACWPTRSCSISTTKRGFPFRIAGSRANAIFLKELRGLSFLDLWRDADREEINSVLHCVADEAQAFLIGAEARPSGLGAVDIEVILLPLRHHGFTHSRVLGGLAVHAAPAWMGLVGAGPIALTSLRALNSSTQEAAGAGGRDAGQLFGSQYAQALQASVCLFRRSAGDLTLRHARRVTAP